MRKIIFTALAAVCVVSGVAWVLAVAFAPARVTAFFRFLDSSAATAHRLGMLGSVHQLLKVPKASGSRVVAGDGRLSMQDSTPGTC